MAGQPNLPSRSQINSAASGNNGDMTNVLLGILAQFLWLQQQNANLQSRVYKLEHP